MIPEGDLAQIQSFCEARSPEHLVDQFRTSMAVRGRTASIVDGQLFDGRWWDRPAVRMKFDPDRSEWTLYWPDRNDVFHRYTDLPPGPIQSLLGEVEADPLGIFWG